ncbi:tudor domain-containing protein 1 isoform X2 [Paramormyrops kingsleyae]|uniref:tudor domain-containing protein 1 isoform X2 n=1 Tax=Paramormyrops kingsleyae TaxID=1676925 RepID=UPI003B975480
MLAGNMNNTFLQAHLKAPKRPTTNPVSVAQQREQGNLELQAVCGTMPKVPWGSLSAGLELNAEKKVASVTGNGCANIRREVSPTVVAASLVKLCNFCAQQGNLRCIRCKRVCYCSVTCQAKDWAAHRHVCKPETPERSPCEEPQELLASPSTASSRSLLPRGDVGVASPLQKLYLRDFPKNELIRGAQIQATVVELRNPGKFFIHVESKAVMESLRSVTVMLQKMYAGSTGTEYMPDCGEACAVMYSQDRNWYRGVVQSVDISQKTAMVFYMDYGNEEVVPLDRIRPLASCVDRIPPCAVHCQVAGVTVVTGGWPEECSVAVRQLVAGKSLAVTVVDKLDGGPWAVDMELTAVGSKLSMFLVENGYATMEPRGQDIDSILSAALDNFKKSSAGKNENMESCLPSPLTQGVGDVFSVVVTHLRSPEDLICQKLDNAGAIQELQQKLREHCMQTAADPDFRPAPGSVCCCRFSEDSQWYRAKVLGYSTEQHVCVGYIDFGNSEEVDLDQLRPIGPELLRLPTQAIPCALAGMKPLSDTWTEASVVMLRKIVCNRFLQMKVLGQRSSTALVSLLDEGSDPAICVAEFLVTTGYALYDSGGHIPGQDDKAPSPPAAVEPKEELHWTNAELPADGELVDVMVTVVQNPTEFFCHQSSSQGTRTLAALMADLAKHSQSSDAALVASVGRPCCAQFPGDKLWYRAMVQSILPDGKVEVFFMDYGNTCVVDRAELRSIRPEHLKVPFQALRCWLAGVEPLGRQWSAKALQKFRAFCVGTHLQGRALHVTERGYGMELLHDGLSIATLLVAEGLASSTPGSGLSGASDKGSAQSDAAAVPLVASFPTGWQTAQLQQNKTFQARVAGVLSPGHFYLLGETEVSAEKLHTLMGALQEHCSRRPQDLHALPEPGAACCAQFSGDKKWYRAVVLEVGDSEAKVVYADYGNTERVPLSGLQPITSAHLDPPFRIVRCALTGMVPLPSPWLASAGRRFELLLDAPVLACAHGFDGTYNLLTMTSHGEKGNVHINSALKDSLVEEEGPAVGPSEWESAAGPRDAACVPRGCLDKVMGKDGAKADIQQETGREEAELVSGVCNEPTRTALSSCCCGDLKQKVDQIEALLLVIVKQMGFSPKP